MSWKSLSTQQAMKYCRYSCLLLPSSSSSSSVQHLFIYSALSQ